MNETPSHGQKAPAADATLFRLAVAFLVCASLGAAAASLLWPLSWDEGIFAWIGGVLAHSGTPYVDAWDVKGPVAYAVYALAETLFGTSAYGLRILDLLFTVAGTATVYRLINQMLGQRAALLGSLLLFISVLGQGYNVNGQPDLWAGWCLVFAVSALTFPPTALRMAVAAMFLGIAVLIKPVYAAMGLLLLFPIAYNTPREWSTIARSVLAMIVGGMIPIALCVAWFWSRGAGGAFYDAYIGFNVESGASNQHTLSGVTSAMLAFLVSRRAVLVSIPAICIGLFAQSKSAETFIPVWKTRLLTTWIVMLLALIILQNRWFTYHWAPTYAPLAIAASIGFYRLLSWKREQSAGRFVHWLAIGGIALIVAGASLAPVRQTLRAANLGTHRITQQDYLQMFDDYPGEFTASDVRLATDYAKAHTQPSDYVFVWEDPYVNVLSGRRTPGRFAFWTPLLPPGNAPLTPRYEANRAEFFRALDEHAPALLLMERDAWRDGNPRTIANVPAKFPALMQWIEERYVQSDTVGRFLAFTKR